MYLTRISKHWHTAKEPVFSQDVSNMYGFDCVHTYIMIFFLKVMITFSGADLEYFLGGFYMSQKMIIERHVKRANVLNPCPLLLNDNPPPSLEWNLRGGGYS